ncbi:MAG: DUF58 domain-containing protein [Anaerolineaceae bacterium]|nr:DUF58 domain-containing protein [Anaerolineaceae bacterium]
MQPTNRGILILLLTAPILAAATWLPIMQWLALGYFVLACLLIWFDWKTAEPIEKRFDIRREHDQKLSLGADNPIKVFVRNRSNRPAKVWLRDEPPDEFNISERLLSSDIAPRRTWEATYYVHPLRRGDYQFGNLNLRWQGPLGLAIRQGHLPLTELVKVYPNLLDVRRYDLLLRRNRLQEIGLRNTRQFGEGTEFERLREYLPDDEYRRIDWKATARRHRPVTVEYQTERSQNVIALLDVGRMMQSPVAQMAKLDYVVNAVLLLGYVATGKGDKVGLMSFANDIQHYLSPRQGRGQFYRMLELLYAVEAQPVESNYRRALSYLAAKQRKRSLVVIFTDLTHGVSMEGLVSHVALLARRSLPLVVTISDPDVVQAAQQQPEDSQTAYQRMAASQLLDQRQVTLDHLRQQGVLTLDVPANQLSIAVINRYLELKAKTML